MTNTKARRTWPQRLTLVSVVVSAIVCFAAAGALAAGQWVVAQRQLVTIDRPDARLAGADDLTVIVPGGANNQPDNGANTNATTIVLAEPDAANFLITGADNNDCPGAESSTGDRSDLGERSDTIMIWRANPDTNQLAVLSLPRDLYVKGPNGGKTKINSQYRRDDPDRLIDTIYLNFGIPIDHYIQIDFCAFKRLVNAVGGVTVPFEFPARDRKSNLNIPTAGCVTLDGDMALAYVRSRAYQFEDPAGSGNWQSDGTSDFGRIKRQQDFLRRVVAEIIRDGLYQPDVASALITTNREYLVTDSGLSLRTMIEFGNTLRSLNPADIATYIVESSSENVNGQSVQRPRIEGDNMKAILAVFRGQAALAQAPAQEFETTTTTTTPTTTTTTRTATSPTTTTTTRTATPAGSTTTIVNDESGTTDEPTVSTLPTVEAVENVTGEAPDPTAVCN